MATSTSVVPIPGVGMVTLAELQDQRPLMAMPPWMRPGWHRRHRPWGPRDFHPPVLIEQGPPSMLRPPDAVITGYGDWGLSTDSVGVREGLLVRKYLRQAKALERKAKRHNLVRRFDLAKEELKAARQLRHQATAILTAGKGKIIGKSHGHTPLQSGLWKLRHGGHLTPAERHAVAAWNARQSRAFHPPEHPVPGYGPQKREAPLYAMKAFNQPGGFQDFRPPMARSAGIGPGSEGGKEIDVLQPETELMDDDQQAETDAATDASLEASGLDGGGDTGEGWPWWYWAIGGIVVLGIGAAVMKGKKGAGGTKIMPLFSGSKSSPGSFSSSKAA